MRTKSIKVKDETYEAWRSLSKRFSMPITEVSHRLTTEIDAKEILRVFSDTPPSNKYRKKPRRS